MVRFLCQTLRGQKQRLGFVYKSFMFRVIIGAWGSKKEDDWVGEEVDRDRLARRWPCSVSVHLQRRHLSHFENDDSELV